MSLEPPPPKIPVFHPALVAGQTALVTGAATGLGRAIAQQLAEAGADLVLAARNLERLEETAAEIRAATGRRVEAAMVNIRDRASVEALAALVRERHGQVDMLINNAGGQFAQRARDFSPKGWNAVIETNLTGTWNMTQVFGTQMLDGRGGSITNIIAVIGRGFPGIAHTAAARAGVLELSKTLAIEWGPQALVVGGERRLLDAVREQVAGHRQLRKEHQLCPGLAGEADHLDVAFEVVTELAGARRHLRHRDDEIRPALRDRHAVSVTCGRAVASPGDTDVGGDRGRTRAGAGGRLANPRV